MLRAETRDREKLAIGLVVVTILAATANYNPASGFGGEEVTIKIGDVFQILGANCFTATVTAEVDAYLTLYTWIMLASEGYGRVYENHYYALLELEADVPQNVTFCESDRILLKDSIILEALQE